MQQNTINMQANNELAKPLNTSADHPYSNNADNPYDTRSHKDSLELEYYQPKAYAPQPQVIVIEDPQNERPADWLCFAKDSLQSRARMNFVRKVYLLLALELLVTIGFCCLSYFVKGFFEFQIKYWWVTLIAVAFMYTMVALILCTDKYRRAPYNVVFLTLFTLSFSYMLSQFTSLYAYYYGGPLVLTAAGLTLFMVVGLTLFAIFSRNDLNMLLGVAIILLFSFCGFGFLCIFTFNPIMYQLYCAIAVAIVGILLIIETKMIIGGQKSIQIPMDDYVLGSLILYIDIMRLFMLILQLLGASRR